MKKLLIFLIFLTSILFVFFVNNCDDDDSIVVLTPTPDHGDLVFIDHNGQVLLNFPAGYEYAGDFSEGLVALKDPATEKIGYFNVSGDQVIEPQFTYADSFKNGVAWFQENDRLYYGLIIKAEDEFTITDCEFIYFDIVNNNKIIVQKKDYSSFVILNNNYYGPFDSIQYCNEEVEIFIIKKNDKYGYLFASGLYIEPQFDYANPFKEDLALVEKDSLYGFLDSNGNIAIPLNLGITFSFSEGLAFSRQGGVFGYIDKTGNWAISPQFEMAQNFQNGMAPVEDSGGFGYIDTSGNFLSTQRWNTALPFYNGVALIEDVGLYGYIDTNLNYIVTPQFTDANSLYEEFARVEKNNVYGFVNIQGIYIEPIYYLADEFFNGTAKIFNSEYKMGLLLENGHIVEPQFDWIRAFHENMAIVNLTELYGYISIDGTIIEPQFTEAEDFSEGVAKVVTTENQEGYIYPDGSWALLTPNYHDCHSFSEGMAACYYN